MLLLRSKADGKCRPLSDARGNVQFTTMPVEDVLDDREPQTGTPLFAACRHADAIEPLGQPGEVLWGDARAVVRHGGDEAGRAATTGRLAPNADHYAPAMPAVLDGVLHEVLEHLHDFVAVPPNDRGFSQAVELDGRAGLASDRL